MAKSIDTLGSGIWLPVVAMEKLVIVASNRFPLDAGNSSLKPLPVKPNANVSNTSVLSGVMSFP